MRPCTTAEDSAVMVSRFSTCSVAALQSKEMAIAIIERGTLIRMPSNVAWKFAHANYPLDRFCNSRSLHVWASTASTSVCETPNIHRKLLCGTPFDPVLGHGHFATRHVDFQRYIHRLSWIGLCR